MKKRIVSFSIVFMMMLSGVFSCVASAATRDGVAEYLFDGYFDLLKDGSDLIQDIFGWGDETREYVRDKLREGLFDQEGAADDDTIISSDSEYSYGYMKNVSTSIYSAPQNTWNPEYITHKAGKALKCTLDPGATFVFNASCKNSYAFAYQFYYSDGTYVSGMGKYNSSCRSPQTITNPFGRQMFLYVRVEVDVWPKDTTGESLATMQVTGEGDGFRWGWDTELHWSGSFNINAINDLEIGLAASRDLDQEIDGEFYISAGILYKTDTDATYASDHVRGETVTSGKKWNWAFDMGELSYYLYRKRCGYENFKAFVSVYSLKKGGYVYSKEYPLNIPPPEGVFKDVEDPPGWDDFKPDPEPMPEPPTYIFNYDTTNNNNTWQSYTWQTINNYTINEGGSGGSGGSGSGGGDDSDPDPDSSSEPDPNDDSSGSDPNDPSSGSDPIETGSDFDDWLAEALRTINDNITHAYEVTNNNLAVINENIEGFCLAVSDFITNGFKDTMDYIAELIKKFNTDFNNWTEAFSKYIEAQADTLNHNIAIVGDNIVEAIKDNLVPDKDEVYNIMINKCTFFKQSKDILSDKEVQQREFKATIPLGSDELAFDVDFGEILSAPYYSQIRSAANVFILAATFFGAINIILKIFGLGFGSGNDE